MPGWAVEGPDGVAGPPTRPPVVVAGVDAAGNIRRILTDTTGAQHIVIDSGSVTTGGLTDTQLRASAVPVSLASLPALAAGSAVIGHVIVDSGAVTATLAAETTKVIGTVNQGTSPWAVSLAAETTKVLGVTRTADGAGTLLTSTGAALDINIKSGNPTTIQANAGTNLNTSALALDATLTGGTQISRAQGIYNVTQPSPADTGQVQLQTDSRGRLRVTVGQNASDANVQSDADGINGTQTSLATQAKSFLFNGSASTGWDRARGNWNTTTGDTGAKIANFLGATQTNYNARGAIITILIGTVTGTSPTIQTGIQWSYDDGTTWLPLTALGASITPASGNTIVWHVYPGIATLTPAASGGVSAATQYNYASIVLPRKWRIAATIGGTNPSITLTSASPNYIV